MTSTERGRMTITKSSSVFTADDPDIDSYKENFYVRVYTGGIRSSRIGHEFIEYDIRYDANQNCGVLRYANQSNYRDEELITKEVGLSLIIIQEIKRLVQHSEILLESDEKWPEATSNSKQELEIRVGNRVKKLTTKKLTSIVETKSSEDPEGLKVYYYFIQNLRSLIYSLVSLHYKIKPVQR